MKDNDLNNLFEPLKGKFDIESPSPGHETRFLEKLKASDSETITLNNKSNFSWKPWLAIAASFVIGMSLFLFNQRDPKVLDLANVSTELSETQDFFTITINNELKKLKQERSPFTETVINDALKQIDILEKEYQNLKADLTESGTDQRVIYAMITNYQNRIEILNTVLLHIEELKQLKFNTNELKNTI